MDDALAEVGLTRSELEYLAESNYASAPIAKAILADLGD